MSILTIADQFGLNISTTPNASSSLSKYLKNPSAIKAELGNVKDIRNLAIKDDPFTSQSVKMSFDQPLTLGSTGVALTIKPSLATTLAISTGKPLFSADTDLFGDTITIPADNAFVSMSFQASLVVSASAAPPSLCFGFTSQTTVTFTDYRLFPTSDPIVGALTTLVDNFIIPGDISDIEPMPAGSIATVAGSGTLKFSAEMDMPASVNPLATVTDTMLDGLVSLKAGGSAKVKGSFTVTGGYQIRIQRLDGRKFQLGVLKQRSTELDVSVEADLSATVTAAGKDWITTLMQMASKDPAISKDTFKQGGLTDDQISSINAAIKTGVERSLQLSVSAELDALQQSSAAFSYLIDLDAADTAATDAINLALKGDLTGLESGTLAGVKPIRSIFLSLKQRKEILKLNVLGIFNVASLTTLVQQGKVIVDQDSGSVTITDKTTASTIGYSAANFAKDTAKLRQILADSVMITAAYRTAGNGTTTQFGTSLWFFEFRQKTNLDNMSDYFNISLALAARSQQQIDADLSTLKNAGNALGRSILNINATYSDDQFRSLFLTGEAARPESDYEDISRQALMALLPAGNQTNNARRVPLLQPDLWNQMKNIYESQDPTLATFFSNYPNLQPFAGPMTADFLLTHWWSTAMSKMATALAALLAYFKQNPSWSKDDSQFKHLHDALNKSMASVSSNTKNDYHEPLGVLAMDLASNQKAVTTVQLSSPVLSFMTSREAQQVTAAS